MKKYYAVFVLLCAALLLISAGCGQSLLERREDSVDQSNAINIATAINSFNALNPHNKIMSLDGLDTIEKLKAAVGESLWPRGLSDEDVRNALRFLTLENGVANVKPLNH